MLTMAVTHRKLWNQWCCW